MIAAFCVSPIPSIRMNTGINARNGIGLKSPNSPAKILSTGFHNPRSIPKTTPNTIPIRKPCPTLKKLMERFFHNFPVLTRLCNVAASLVGFGKSIPFTDPRFTPISQSITKSTGRIAGTRFRIITSALRCSFPLIPIMSFL